MEVDVAMESDYLKTYNRKRYIEETAANLLDKYAKNDFFLKNFVPRFEALVKGIV